MKKIICLFVVFLQPMIVRADYIEQNEKIFTSISRLEDKLKELELKQKIQKIELEIKENAEALMDKPKIEEKVIVKSPVIQPSKPVRRTPAKPAFKPEDVQLLYLIGSGMNRNAVVFYKSNNSTLRNNTLFNGWRVQIRQNEVALVRGDRRVTL